MLSRDSTHAAAMMRTALPLLAYAALAGVVVQTRRELADVRLEQQLSHADPGGSRKLRDDGDISPPPQANSEEQWRSPGFAPGRDDIGDISPPVPDDGPGWAPGRDDSKIPPHFEESDGRLPSDRIISVCHLEKKR